MPSPSEDSAGLIFGRTCRSWAGNPLWKEVCCSKCCLECWNQLPDNVHLWTNRNCSAAAWKLPRVSGLLQQFFSESPGEHLAARVVLRSPVMTNLFGALKRCQVTRGFQSELGCVCPGVTAWLCHPLLLNWCYIRCWAEGAAQWR